MDIERGFVRTLFNDYPLERIVTMIVGEKTGKWLFEIVPDLMKWRMPYFDEKELSQFMCEFERECKNEFADIEDKLWPLFYVAKVGYRLITLEHNRPVVKSEELFRWRVLSLETSEDLLTLSWLAMKEKDQSETRTDFAWEDTLLVNESFRNEIVGHKTMCDIHAHISHSSDAFGIRWVYWMNNCWDKPKMIEAKKWACIAAVIRCYIFQIVTGRGCPGRQDIIDVISAVEGGETLQILHNIIYNLFDKASNNSIKPNFDGIEHWDYALQQDWVEKVGKRVMKSPYMMLAGERWLIYSFLKKLYKNHREAEQFALMFYLYLLIKAKCRNGYIHTNGLIGLFNYQQYEKADSEDQLEHLGEAKRRYAIQTALGAKGNNYLEARVSLDFNKKNKENTTNRIESALANIRIEVPLFGNGNRKREYLLKQVRLVVTNSKKKYSRKERLTYFQQKKQDFDRIIDRASRNRELDKKDFSLVGIDFCSSDEYARPEVYAQLVRYARKKKFKNFTYHAGEDFYDLMDGLRTIEEILLFLGWDKYCRLGHTIALGIDAQKYYQNRGRYVIITRQVLLDNLSWYLAKQEEYDFALNQKTKGILEEKIRSLYEEIGYDLGFDLQLYQNSMKLRGDHTRKGIKAEALQLFAECALDERPELDELRSDSHVKTLFDEYYDDTDIYQRGSEIIHWKMPSGVERGLKEIQKQLLLQIKQKNIAIETCPTSNYVIGPFSRYDELPLNTFLEKLPDNRISINTDDKGIVATSIDGEYALIAASMAKRGVSKKKIKTIMDRINANTKASLFRI